MNPERITDHIRTILSLPEPERKRRATRFLARFQAEMVQCPDAAGAQGLDKALFGLYNYFGSRAQREKRYDEAMLWFEKSLCLAGVSEVRRREFHEIFLYLAYFYLSLSKYALAMHYTGLYKRYNPSVADFCDDVIRSMDNVRGLGKRLLMRGGSF